MAAGTAGKRKHVTSTAPQKPEIIRRLESYDSHTGCDLCNIGLIYDI
jgi:hypothetical protein